MPFRPIDQPTRDRQAPQGAGAWARWLGLTWLSLAGLLLWLCPKAWAHDSLGGEFAHRTGDSAGSLGPAAQNSENSAPVDLSGPPADSAESVADSDWTLVALLGAIQGLTEFLPVSSSGHLTLAKAAFGFEAVSGPLLVVALHLGTLLAVLWVYWRDLLGLLREALHGRLRPLLLLFLGSLPAGIIGLSLKSQLEALFERPEVAAGCLLFTASLLLVSDIWQRRQAPPVVPDRALDPSGIASLSYRQALIIGVMQAVAILPGVSRSGSTIATGLLVGLDAARAARFSFLLSLPAVGGATLLECLDASAEEARQGGLLLFGVLISALVGLASLKLLLVVLRRGAFRWFALYCALVGSGWLLFGSSGAA
jgi:undecaprenyl-diphosphatase